jgi:hypothetical protein
MIAIALAMLAGCATMGGGQTNPILSQFVPKTLQDNPVILNGNATNSCNAAAAQEYNLNMVICADPTKFAASLPGNPFVTQAQIAQAIGVVCATNGYNSGLAAQVDPGNCVFPAPTAEAKRKQMMWAHSAL